MNHEEEKKKKKTHKFFYLDHKLLLKIKLRMQSFQSFVFKSPQFSYFYIKKKKPGNLITILTNSSESNFNE